MRCILIAGAKGTLGSALARVCTAHCLEHRALSREELDIADDAAIARALDRYAPWLVINAAGYVRVDDAEREPERCRRENVHGPEKLARRCAAAKVGLLSFSSDLVFDGRKDAPYLETDSPRPLGVYGQSKYEAEQRILDRHPGALIVRTSAFFGPWDDHNFVTVSLRELSLGRSVHAPQDLVVSATYVPDLARACLDLAMDRESGLWHLANDGALSWADLLRSAARLGGATPEGIHGVRTRDLTDGAPRPAFSALASSRGALLPPLESALARYHADRP